jgi:CheY-like chemotaxis protein
LLQLRREQELARLREDFVASVSHELRTPLAQVRMFAETLRLGRIRSEGERARSLEIIDQEARRLTHLVENILLFSRPSGTQVRLSPRPCVLSAEVREALHSFAPIAAARRVASSQSLDDDACAMVDVEAFRQIVLNLVDNAIKYSPAEARSGSRSRRRAPSFDSRWWTKDRASRPRTASGSGHPTSASSATSRRRWRERDRVGRGARSRAAARRARRRRAARPRARWIALLRRAATLAERRADVRPALRPRTRRSSPSRDGERRMTTRILVVEDNPDLAFGLRNNFEIEGYEVDVADDGLKGLERRAVGSPTSSCST